jgi:hypothetical protein
MFMATVAGSACFAAAVCAVAFMLYVDEGKVDNIYHMLVIQRVKYVLAVTAAFYEAFVFKKAELV